MEWEEEKYCPGEEKTRVRVTSVLNESDGEDEGGRERERERGWIMLKSQK